MVFGIEQTDKMEIKMPRRHKSDTKTFEEETYAEQAKTINAAIVYLGKVIKANIKRAKLEGKKIQKINELRI